MSVVSVVRPLRGLVLLVMAAASGAVGSAGCVGGPRGVAPEQRSEVRRPAKPGLTRAARPRAPMRFLKGQTHAHTGNSGDSHTPPEVVVGYYEDWGFDFVVLTDHNFVTELPAGVTESMLVFSGVELTQNPRDCDPPQEPGVKDCLVHLNVLFVDTPAPANIPWPAKRPLLKVIDFYQRALDAAGTLGGVIQLNHPNFHWTASSGALIAELARRGVALVEVANQGMPISNPGDATHASTEQLWDDALTAGAVVWGVASDDAHHYDDYEEKVAEGSRNIYPGNRGWIMVHAAPDRDAIREAIVAGDFYASNGVDLDRVEITGRGLEIDVATTQPGDHTFVFIGAGGAEIARQTGRRAKFDLSTVSSGYVRAVVIAPDGRKAWTQPVFVD